MKKTNNFAKKCMIIAIIGKEKQSLYEIHRKNFIYAQKTMLKVCLKGQSSFFMNFEFEFCILCGFLLELNL